MASGVRSELRDALDDAMLRAYCEPLFSPRPEEDPEIVRAIARAAIISDTAAMRHLARVQAAAWAVVEEWVEVPDGEG
jgi:hypothetical protein